MFGRVFEVEVCRCIISLYLHVQLAVHALIYIWDL